MQIGEYELHPVETGRFALDGGAMFGVVPRVLWERTNPPDERNRIDLALRGLLICGQDRLILVDTGIGTNHDAKFADIYRIDHSIYRLETSLQQYGFRPEDVTDVILSHLHFDHVGGSIRQEGGEFLPTFLGARYYVQEAHYRWATHPTERDRASFLPQRFLPLAESGRLVFLNGEVEFLPGIHILVSNSHTVAQQLVKVTDGRTTLLYCADLIPTTSHIPIPWVMAYDLYPQTTLEEKKHFLSQAVEEQWILFFGHDPWTAAARVQRTEKGSARIEYRMGEKVAL